MTPITRRDRCHAAQPCAPVTVPELLYCAVHHSAMPPKVIADALQMRTGYLLDAANPHRADTQFQLRKLVPLIHATGRYDLMDVLARLAGGVYFRRPEATADHLDIIEHAAQVMGECGDVLTVLRGSLEDGAITPREADRILKEIDEGIAALAALRELVPQKVRPGRVLQKVTA